MDSSTAQEMEMSSQTLESMLVCRNVNTQPQPQQEKKPKAASAAEMQHALKCPRCDSANTKFCYYNNYSLSQPRYFCKSCRRYWTKGGTLRNVPVGGGCRKNKRSSSSSSSSSSSKRTPEQPLPSTPIPSFSYDSSDLTLAIARLQKQSTNQFGADDFSIWANPNMPQHHGGIFGNNNSSSLFGFSETPAAQSLYYGMGNLELENAVGGIGMSGGTTQGTGIPFQDFGGGGGATTASTAVTTVKQEMCSAGSGREGDGRVLWGFPWQNMGSGGGGGGSAVPEFDSGRGNWNGIGVTNWQGLLNSPLM